MDGKICGLGAFAEDAAKAGYTNPDGTVNLLLAQEVAKRYDGLVPKSSLTAEELADINAAVQKIDERYNPPKDVFQKS